MAHAITRGKKQGMIRVGQPGSLAVDMKQSEIDLQDLAKDLAVFVLHFCKLIGSALTLLQNWIHWIENEIEGAMQTMSVCCSPESEIDGSRNIRLLPATVTFGQWVLLEWEWTPVYFLTSKGTVHSSIQTVSAKHIFHAAFLKFWWPFVLRFCINAK